MCRSLTNLDQHPSGIWSSVGRDLREEVGEENCTSQTSMLGRGRCTFYFTGQATPLAASRMAAAKGISASSSENGPNLASFILISGAVFT